MRRPRAWGGIFAGVEVMEALTDGVAFSPIQDASGDPAVSLRLGTTVAGSRRG